MSHNSYSLLRVLSLERKYLSNLGRLMLAFSSWVDSKKVAQLEMCYVLILKHLININKKV